MNRDDAAGELMTIWAQPSDTRDDRMNATRDEFLANETALAAEAEHAPAEAADAPEAPMDDAPEDPGARPDSLEMAQMGAAADG